MSTTVLAWLAYFLGAWWLLNRFLPRLVWLRRLLLIPAIILALFIYPFTNNLVVGWLEHSVPRSAPDQCSARTVVILPGGVRASNETAASRIAPATLNRLVEGVSLAGRTGAGSIRFAGSQGEVDSAEKVLAHLGVDGPRWLPDGAAYTTALAAERMDSSDSSVWLVTSALHMPRSMLAFQARGIHVCPWPVDFLAQPAPRPWWIFPSGATLTRADRAIHELVGIVWYWLRGWI